MSEMKEIKNFFESGTGKQLKRILIENILELENIQNIKELNSAEELALEIKAQQKAAKQLRKILSQFSNFEQGRGKEEKDKYYIL